jgi:hypothetical protein
VLSFPNRDGYGAHVYIGDNRGLKSWRLVYENLETDPNGGCNVTLEDGSIVSAHQYYWQFFDRHHSPEVKPFTIVCPEDGLEYTAEFVEHRRSLRWLQLGLWSASGVPIRQVRSSGEALEGMEQPNDLI